MTVSILYYRTRDLHFVLVQGERKKERGLTFRLIILLRYFYILKIEFWTYQPPSPVFFLSHTSDKLYAIKIETIDINFRRQIY